jgi:hypothetical protein
MLRSLAIVVLCLGVATLGFARLCPCDHEAVTAVVEQDVAEHGDCPHSKAAELESGAAPEGDQDCSHCSACVLVPAVPLPVPGALHEAPLHVDFAHALLPRCQGSSSLPLRPPIA